MQIELSHCWHEGAMAQPCRIWAIAANVLPVLPTKNNSNGKGSSKGDKKVETLLSWLGTTTDADSFDLLWATAAEDRGPLLFATSGHVLLLRVGKSAVQSESSDGRMPTCGVF
ncbi:unnamed protein product [Ostreobium quekettii]|uniref:Uncharacterized protein n=1 Tax=Ostreobium quekettii TaxID=121088 RepID=A0A8S1IUN4_9CHLO|nr:unnamed protein product [Ostreobium quekettii]